LVDQKSNKTQKEVERKITFNVKSYELHNNTISHDEEFRTIEMRILALSLSSDEVNTFNRHLRHLPNQLDLVNLFKHAIRWRQKIENLSRKEFDVLVGGLRMRTKSIPRELLTRLSRWYLINQITHALADELSLKS